ncbi:MAG: phosphoribosyltransferase [Euzebyales bacterium]|nr:phosphoribosyltransferase [Euzebyales bacterium]MDQ3432193.1 phosphoribosyltransferase [Actinomycetota bacterium]
MPQREVLDWAGFGNAGRALAQQVVDDGYRPEIILGIARGGLPVAGSIAYALAVKSCFILNVEYYTGIDERLDEPVVLPPILNLDEAGGARVLIADDVADTGHTLALVRNLCRDKVAEARIAVLYAKSRSIVDCDYVWRRTDRWIDFPWSSEPALVAAPTRFQAAATSQA